MLDNKNIYDIDPSTEGLEESLKNMKPVPKFLWCPSNDEQGQIVSKCTFL